jgi:hypothetical protein
MVIKMKEVTRRMLSARGGLGHAGGHAEIQPLSPIHLSPLSRVIGKREAIEEFLG